MIVVASLHDDVSLHRLGLIRRGGVFIFSPFGLIPA
jgi:hypothetical protein